MKYRALIVLLISTIVMGSAAGIAGAADTRSYITPTFTTNTDGPTIGTTVKSAIEVDGKYYRDSNGNGTLEPFENWELDVDERVNDLVSRMSIDEKLGLLTVGDRGTGTSLDVDSLDGLLDEYTGTVSNMFGTFEAIGTTKAIGELGMRHFIFRGSPKPAYIAKWNNALQQVAESTDNGVPVVIVSNSRNENAEPIFGMNDASGVFSTWPGTLGLAAAALGDIKAGGDAQLITDFAELARTEWDASGLKKGYMYMVDVLTDPRWQRGYGTLGERTDFVTDAITRIIKGFQGSSDGVQSNGVALTIKHFPGGGARENGFDPHYALGQRNVYATEGSLEKYHLPPFKAAVENNASSIMPYYARPYPAKSKTQTYEGTEIDLSEEVGFAFNKAIITDLLRNTMGFKGYINSDTGILGNMAWGVQSLDRPHQAAYAINAGTDAISGLTDVAVLQEMYAQGLVSDDRIDEAAGRLLKEEFLLGLFENPYRDPDNADAVVAEARANDGIYLAHQKSVVLLKNANHTLPLSGDKIAGKNVYVRFFNKSGNTSDATASLKEIFTTRGMTVVDDYASADYAVLFINPASGNYSSATEGYLELDICESKDVVKVDPETGKPTSEMCTETTLKDAGEIITIAQAVHAKGGKVIANVNITLPWLMGNVEPYADALTAGFDTVTDAVIDVMTGVYMPTGVLPVTLPKNDDVISVDSDANCISPNDVPGYEKDQYIPAELLDSNGKGYAYKDSEGNYYESNFGLSITSADLEGERHYIEPKFTLNENGPTIGTTVKSAILVNGKYYRDSNGNGELDPFENWELDIDERVSDLVARMTVDEKLGLLIIGTKGLGINAAKSSLDGLLDEVVNEGDTSIFGTTSVYGTTYDIETLGLRRFILRQNPKPSEIAQWNNAMQQVAEGTSNGVPVVIDSNSRNENGEMTFGMNDASGVFSTWPGTLGLAAAALGDIKAGGDAQLITDFAEISRAEWDASGIKKGYMYMADVVTDPRWQRTYGTFGERPDFVADAIGRVVRGFQGSADGVQPNGVALTTKHFPGGGARENGFDPHYSLGQWNVYPTAGSLEKYHLPPFKAAIANNTSSIMPYYAKPYEAKSAAQTYEGTAIDMSEAVGFAFNKAFIKTLLRETMGHKGYINSDTGIIGNMAWGMMSYDVAERAAYAINAGTDIISGPTDVKALQEAYRRSVEEADKYSADFVLGIDRINEAAGRLLKEEFQLGLFENPYRVPVSADSVVEAARADERVYEAHQKSVVLLKNTDSTLPLTSTKLESKKVYVEFFNKSGETADATTALRNSLAARGMTMTEDYNEADYALLFLNPSSGQYFSATAGFLELDICDGKVVADVDTETGAPISSTHEETTLKDAAKIATIAEVVHGNGGKVIANVNITLAWMMGNVEPYVDALTVGFDTFTDAVIDVMTGVYSPTGVLPLTLPKNDAVIAVDENANCISHNDVSGYDKDQFLPAELLDENGKGYAYKDSEGSYYESLFGLSITSEDEPGTSGESEDKPGEPDTPGTSGESEDKPGEPGTSGEPGTPEDKPGESSHSTPASVELTSTTLNVQDTATAQKIVSILRAIDSSLAANTEVIELTNSKERDEPTDEELALIPSDETIAVILPVMSVDKAAVYVFGVSLDTLSEGAAIFLHLMAEDVNAAELYASDSDEDTYAFLNDSGEKVTTVPANKHVNVAAYMEPDVEYAPVITTSTKDGDTNGPGTPGGGCNTGLTALALAAMLFIARKK